VKFKIDENLPVDVAERMRQEGYDTATAIEQNLSGKSDSEVSALCQREGRILVTLDTDFADIRTYPPEESPGFIVLRLQKQAKDHVMAVIDSLLEALRKENPEHNLWIIEEDRIRIRG
jgi:predicted nuclease of predicted toxin-antitoxin system